MYSGSVKTLLMASVLAVVTPVALADCLQLHNTNLNHTEFDKCAEQHGDYKFVPAKRGYFFSKNWKGGKVRMVESSDGSDAVEIHQCRREKACLKAVKCRDRREKRCVKCVKASPSSDNFLESVTLHADMFGLGYGDLDDNDQGALRQGIYKYLSDECGLNMRHYSMTAIRSVPSTYGDATMITIPATTQAAVQTLENCTGASVVAQDGWRIARSPLSVICEGSYHDEYGGCFFGERSDTNGTEIRVTCSESWFLPCGRLPPNTTMLWISEVEISEDALQSLMPAWQDLTFLLINWGYLLTTPADMSQKMPNLQFLHLGHNEFQSVDSYSFKGLSDLTHLDLSYNSITSISGTAFTDLGKLESLILLQNEITFIDSNAFSALPADATIDLAENRLTRLPDLNTTFDIQTAIFFCPQRPCSIGQFQDGICDTTNSGDCHACKESCQPSLELDLGSCGTGLRQCGSCKLSCPLNATATACGGGGSRVYCDY